MKAVINREIYLNGILSKIFDILSTNGPFRSLHRLTTPPSTNNVWPRIKDVLSDNNQASALVISCGSAMRPIGCINFSDSTSGYLSWVARLCPILCGCVSTVPRSNSICFDSRFCILYCSKFGQAKHSMVACVLGYCRTDKETRVRKLKEVRDFGIKF